MTRRTLTSCSSAALAALLALANGGPRPHSHAQAPAPKGAVIERWDTYPAGSVERQRVVGRLVLTLQPGLTRQQVEAVVGPADDPREIEYLIDADGRRGLSKYYDCQLPHLPPVKQRRFDLVVVGYDVNGPVPILLGVGQDTHTGIKRLVGPEELFR